jgi:hypothetical protein
MAAAAVPVACIACAGTCGWRNPGSTDSGIDIRDGFGCSLACLYYKYVGQGWLPKVDRKEAMMSLSHQFGYLGYSLLELRFQGIRQWRRTRA